MKRPAIFFDRDNTLIVSDGYLGDPSKVELVRGAAEAVARARQLGYVVVVFSNQSGVARGMFSEDDVRAVNARLDQLLKSAHPDAIVDRHEFCPYHPDAVVDDYRRDSDRRKPAPGMIYSAAQALALDLPRSWVIGDAPRDIEAGQTAGCRTILFHNETLPASPAADELVVVEPELMAATLREALEYIASSNHCEPDEQDDDEPDDDDDSDGIPHPFAPIRSNEDAESDERADEEEEAPRFPSRPGPAMRSVAVKLAAQPVPPSAAIAPSAPSGPTGSAAPAPTSVAPPRAAQPDDHARQVLPTARLESIADQILHELRRQTELAHSEFSVSKLLAGIVQVMSFAVMFLAYLNRNDAASFTPMLVFGVWLEVLTVALLIMGRQR